ncbi:MAG TPA: hypothetical protein VNY31_10410 [Solirubrobacteraceae bacterium]|jgi:hypothetical protein|nr:hypothetical protein [Solirubrobacteraceae bacterium]
MLPGATDPAVAANPPGGDLYFSQAAGIASPGEVGPAGAYATAFGTTGHASDLQTAPLAFSSERIDESGNEIALAQHNASGKGHVTEVLNLKGSPVPWIGLALLLLVGLLVISAEFRVKSGSKSLGGEVVL